MKNSPFSHTRQLLAASTLLGSVWFISSCDSNKNAINPNQGFSVNKSVSVNGDWLKFTSLSEFNQTFDQVQAMTEDQRLAWDDNNGISSVADLYKDADTYALQVEDGASTTSARTYGSLSLPALSADSLVASGLVLDMPSPTFARILNYNGIVQIADKIYRITKETSYEFSDTEANHILSGDYRRFDREEPNYDTNAASIDPCNIYWSRLFVQYQDENGNTLPKGDKNKKTRLASVIWNVKTIIRQEAGIRAKFQRDAFIGWVDQKCNAIHVAGGIVYSDAYGTQQASFSARYKPSSLVIDDPTTYPSTKDVKDVEYIPAVGYLNFFNVNQYTVIGTVIFNGVKARRAESCH